MVNNAPMRDMPMYSERLEIATYLGIAALACGIMWLVVESLHFLINAWVSWIFTF